MAKILIVDDSRTSRKVLRGILEADGHEIVGEAPDGAQGAKMYEELKPDMVNAKSTLIVWWTCSTCGYEWKSVIKARVKGTICPVCADRAVLKGYNDLATTDSDLLCEWDYEKNKLTPTEVSRNSMKPVWWKCSHGHSWKDKISNRTIGQAGCKICEKGILCSTDCLSKFSCCSIVSLFTWFIMQSPV